MGTYDILVHAYSPYGTPLWLKTGSNIESQESAHGVDVSADGSIYIAGMTRATLQLDESVLTSTSPYWYPFVAKLGSEITTEILGTDDPAFSIFPNPVEHYLYLPVDASIMEISCTNPIGQQVQVLWIGDHLDVSSLKPGAHILTITTVIR